MVIVSVNGQFSTSIASPSSGASTMSAFRGWKSIATGSREAPRTVRLERFHGQKKSATQLGKHSK